MINYCLGYDPGGFSWSKYLTETQARPVPNSAFGLVNMISAYKKGMKLEVVDKRNPILIRVATIADVFGRHIKVIEFINTYF